jgi:multidrug efflux system membrane fusion protein
MFVRVQVPVSEKHMALLVPQEAIGSDQDKHYVLIVNEQNIVEKRPVDVGDMQPNAMQEVIPQQIVLEKGGYRPAVGEEKAQPSLTKNDRVIVGGLQRVRPGSKADIRKPEQSAEMP